MLNEGPVTHKSNQLSKKQQKKMGLARMARECNEKMHGDLPNQTLTQDLYSIQDAVVLGMETVKMMMLRQMCECMRSGIY